MVQVNGTAGLVLAAVTPSADATMVTDTKISDGGADSTSTYRRWSHRSRTRLMHSRVAAGAMYNQISNTMEHLTNLSANYSLDMGSKLDVDFAGETTNLAKGQILAQAGTAMLAQANAQGQSLLALIQS